MGNAMKWSVKVLAFIVWLASAAFGLVTIYLARQTSVIIYGRFSKDVATATVIGNTVTIIAALVWIGYVIMSGERSLRKIGEGGSWAAFAWAVAIELLIVILYFVV
jgi:hypothetical protein